MSTPEEHFGLTARPEIARFMSPVAHEKVASTL